MLLVSQQVDIEQVLNNIYTAVFVILIPVIIFIKLYQDVYPSLCFTRVCVGTMYQYNIVHKKHTHFSLFFGEKISYITRNI